MKTFHNFYSVPCILLILPLSILQGQNTDLPFGSLPGTADVSTLGAATYTIPIEVVPGTQGIQPSLSITYSSISGTGPLGMGFSLTGLSAVCRKGQTNFHDNNITPIALTYYDRFELDGNRLVNSNASQYGLNGIVYYKEFYDYSKIISYGTAGNGPQYFKVFTDNGQVLEYGNSADSRHTLGNGSTVLNWYINKVTDLNGNYMTYTYGKSGNEMWIDRIDYTGNEAAGLSPYARVQFEYDTGIHVGTVFAAGYAIRQTRLLRAVKVLYKNNGGYELVRQYNLSYSNDSPKKLVSVQLMAADSSVLNPTVFQWNNTVQNIVDTTYYPMNLFLENKPHFIADIDKNGLGDVIEYSYNYWKAFLNYGPACQLYHTEICPDNFFITHCIPADLDGSGFNKIITAYWNPLTRKIYITATGHQFNSELIGDTLSNITNIRGLYSGDILGNGKHQIILFYNQDQFCAFNEGNEYFGNIGGDIIRIIDFDGDGTKEILTGDNFLSIYRFNIWESRFDLLKNIRFGVHVTTGDFNGDGITDLLYHGALGYRIALGNGNGFSNGVPLNTPLQHQCDSLQKMVADVNHDGYDDILTFYYDAENGLKVQYHIGNGYFNDTIHMISSCTNSNPYIPLFQENTLANNICLGDYNGDGNIDLIALTHAPSHKGVTRCHIDESNKSKNSIYKVSKGDASFTQWHYSSINGMFYQYGSCINSAPYRFNVVDTMTTSMGSLSETRSFKYQFLQPTYSFKRKQVMGFLYTSVTDLLLSTTDITHYQNMNDFLFLTGDKCFLMPYHQMHKVNDTLKLDRYFTPDCMFLPPYRMTPRMVADSTINYRDSVVTSCYNLYNIDGRLLSSHNKTYAIGETSFLTRTLSENHYHTLNLTNGSTLTYIDSASTETKLRNSTLNALTTATTTYDNGGRLASKSVSVDGVTKTESINTYDSFGNATSVTTSGTGCTNRTSTLMYDNTGRFAIRHTNPKGHIFQKNHDPRTGLVLSETDENNLTTTYVYDVFGRLDSIRYPDNTYTSCSRHWYTGTSIPKARWYTLTKHTGKANTEEYFDLLGRTVCVVNNSYYTDTRYNLKGQVDQTSAPYSAGTPDADKTWHNYQYDAYGRMIHETAPYKDLTYSYGTRNTTVTDNLRGTVSSKTLDAAGRLVQASDPGGIIQYAYTFDTYNGKTVLKTDVTTGGNTTSILADQRGNRVKISDPDAGIVTCTYNAFGKLASQTDARGVTTAMTYDVLGRVTGKTYSDSTGFLRTVLYTYDQHSSSNKGRGKLSYTTINGTVSEIFLYDNVGRLSQKSKIIDSTLYSETYTYNTYGQTATLTYPDGYAVSFGYKTNGQIETVRQASNSKLLHKIYSYNKFGQPTRCGYGNDLASDLVYNANGLLERILTGNKHSINPIKPLLGEGLETDGLPDPTEPDETLFDIDSTVQNFRYTYDNMGRLVQRTQKNIQHEAFTYDNLDRLTSFTQGTVGGATQAFSTTYDLQGNILSNALAGTYRYDGNKPHAVTSVTPSSGFPDAIPSAQCETEYNFLNQPSRIAEGNVEILLEYGADGQRVKAVYKNNGNVVRTHYYISAYYEKEIDGRGVVTHYHYIYGANGLAAVCMRRGSTDKLFYVHPDRLGSYTHITDENKQVLRALHFDPWGNVKTDTNWTVFAENALSSLYLSYRFDRGFTGHEHYADLKIINMNGRLYDPVIARFFSPDNFVQVPDFTQSYNRYSYCLNNPLQYVDPSGESIVLAMILGAAANVVFQSLAGNINGNSDLLWSFFVGGLAGLAGGFAGEAAAAAVGVGGFIGGASYGAAAGAAGGFITGTGNALIGGNDFATSLGYGCFGGVTGALFGGLTGGLASGITDAIHGYNFWDGSRIDEFVVGNTQMTQDFSKIGTLYDNSDNAIYNDMYLKYRIENVFGIKESDFEIDAITTRSEGYGLTPSGLYVNKNGDLVGGYVRSFSVGSGDLHISPYYTNAADIPFMAVTGHEITHSYHHFILGKYYQRIWSEMVAYRYTYNTYLNSYSYYNQAFSTFSTAMRSQFWGYFYPSNYNIPSPYLFY